MVCSAIIALALVLQPNPESLIPLYLEALERREADLGPDHPRVARSSSDLGLYLKKIGNTSAALPYLRRALEIDTRAFGGTDPRTAEDAEHVASLIEPRAAEAMLARASECSDPKIAARILGKLGSLQDQLGDIPAAVESLRKALAKEESAADPDHPRIAVRLNDLALMLEPKAAEPLLRRAIAIQAKALGLSHPETAITSNNLANVLLGLGRLKEAERVQRGAIKVLESSLGREHPRVAVSCSNLADILRAKGDAAGARRLYQRALAIDEKVYGPNHPEVSADLENLAGLLEEMGELTEAGRLKRRAAAITRAQ
jgi:tetratricopeptide (TPR) repeat protein